MDDKYYIILNQEEGKHYLKLQINDGTEKFKIDFLDFSRDEIQINTISQFDLGSTPHIVKREITESFINEINLISKIRVKINGMIGCFSADKKGLFVFSTDRISQNLPLVECILLEKLDDKVARIKVYFNYIGTSVHFNRSPGDLTLDKAVVWKGIYSHKPNILINTLLKSKGLVEDYEISTTELGGVGEIIVLKDISKYKKSVPTKHQNSTSPTQASAEIKLTQPAQKLKNEDQYRIEEINKLKAEIAHLKIEVKKLQEENASLYSQKDKLENDKKSLNTEIAKYIEYKQKSADAIKKEEKFNEIIADLKPYKDFFEQYSGNKKIDEISRGFEEFSRYCESVRNLSKQGQNTQGQNETEVFDAFFGLNKILLFQDVANDTILDKIASDQRKFSVPLEKFRELLTAINYSVIDSCKNEEGFSLKAIPSRITNELAKPDNHSVLTEFNHSFLDLDVRFTDFSEPNWDILLEILENLRKLVNIKQDV